MLKESGYQEKFEMLQPWLVEIIDGVKRDLKNEHFRKDPGFCRRYFMGKNPNQVGSEEMAVAYAKEVREGNVGLGEFIATRWLLRNTDLYGFFEERLSKIDEQFEHLDTLDEKMSLELMNEAVHSFGAKKSYLFSVLNSVVFPKSVYDRFRTLALEESQSAARKENEEAESRSLEALQKRHAREIAAITDRYEKKLSGLQRKYLNDMEKARKEISSLKEPKE